MGIAQEDVVADGIRITCRGADSLPLDVIEDFQGNLKKRSAKDIGLIIKSIETYGFSFPFFVWNGSGHNYCLDGHGRIQALCEMRKRGVSLPLFPVAYIEAADEAEAKQKLLRLNSQYGQMSIDSVMEFMDGLEIAQDEIALPTGTMKFTGLDATETTGDDEVPGLLAEPITAAGDVYTLTTGRGTHRLICGDSRDPKTVSSIMQGRLIDLWLTDPPYNVDYTGKTKEALKITNDKMADAAFLEFLTGAFKPAEQSLKPGGVFYILHAPTETPNFWNALATTGLEVRQALVWNKNSMVMGRQDYQWKHEGILYGWKGGAPHFWDGGRAQTTVREDSLEKPPEDMKKEELLALVKTLQAERRAIPTSVIDCDRPSRSSEHPTMKPVRLLAKFILNSSKKKGLIFDGFGGSGSTMIAAEQTGRICYMVELDPHYCDVIVKRYASWAEENGRQPLVTHNGRPYEEMKPVEPGKNRRHNPADAIRPGSIQKASA